MTLNHQQEARKPIIYRYFSKCYLFPFLFFFCIFLPLFSLFPSFAYIIFVIINFSLFLFVNSDYWRKEKNTNLHPSAFINATINKKVTFLNKFPQLIVVGNKTQTPTNSDSIEKTIKTEEYNSFIWYYTLKNYTNFGKKCSLMIT